MCVKVENHPKKTQFLFVRCGFTFKSKQSFFFFFCKANVANVNFRFLSSVVRILTCLKKRCVYILGIISTLGYDHVVLKSPMYCMKTAFPIVLP